jgi:hypothetical protein
VIELAVGPQHRVMTVLACGGEAQLYVVNGSGGRVVVVLVTRDAGRVGEVVVVVDVALAALGGGVRAGQWESGGGVIELAIGPEHCVMTILAGGGEAQLDVVNGSSGRVVVVQVTRDAGRVGEVVIVVDVALAALGRGVRAGQREAGGGVIELTIGPQHRVMAILAGRGEAQLDVVNGRSGRVVVVLVTRYAGRIGEVVVVVDVALAALRSSVRPGQWEAGGGMIELAVGPQHRVVTVLAGRWEAQLDVVNGSGGRVVVVLVAADASRVRTGQVVVVVYVALRAGDSCVRAGQRES